MTFPFYFNFLEKPRQTPVELPPSPYSAQTRPESYLPDNGLVDAVNVALLLNQPLLLTGEPGTGKTQLAYNLAYQLGLGEPLIFETKSSSTARDLFYVYDTLGRFHAAQSVQLGEKIQHNRSVDYLTYNALGLAIVLTNPPENIEAFLPADLVHSEPRRSVVLIDEIDKASRDFPNDILTEIEQMYFRIPELGNVKIIAEANMRPVVVMTSNSEKPLPDAFLRRCVYYNIPFPDQERLITIVEARLGEFVKQSSDFLSDALDLFVVLREKGGLRKKPATAELLNWLSVLRGLFKEVENPIATHPDSILRTLSSLVKTIEDQKMAQRIVQAWFESKQRS
jgi:MoxR-like ATPase